MHWQEIIYCYWVKQWVARKENIQLLEQFRVQQNVGRYIVMNIWGSGQTWWRESHNHSPQTNNLAGKQEQWKVGISNQLLILFEYFWTCSDGKQLLVWTGWTVLSLCFNFLHSSDEIYYQWQFSIIFICFDITNICWNLC